MRSIRCVQLRANAVVDIVLVMLSLIITTLGSSAYAQQAAIETMEQAEAMPLINISALKYEGGFRLPSDQFGDSELSTHSYSSGAFTFNPANNSLFTTSHERQGGIGEFAIPSVVKSNDPNEFSTATMLQNFRTFHQAGAAPTGIDDYFQVTGLAVVNNKLVVNFMDWYDAGGLETDTSAVFQNPDNLRDSDVIGPFQIEGAARTSGWLTPIPDIWQDALGGDYIAGHAHGSILSRLSVGPPAYSLNVGDLTNATEGGPIASNELVNFDLVNPLYDTSVYNLETDSLNYIMYNDSLENTLYTQVSGAAHGFIVPNTGTYMTLGFAGGFESRIGYKNTQTDGNVCDGPCSFDPEDNYNFYWLWKVSDLMKVKRGLMLPKDVRPYEHGKLDTLGSRAQIRGAAYDYANKRLYVSLHKGDTTATYSRPPLILVYSLEEGQGSVGETSCRLI